MSALLIVQNEHGPPTEVVCCHEDCAAGIALVEFPGQWWEVIDVEGEVVLSSETFADDVQSCRSPQAFPNIGFAEGPA